MNAIKKYIVIAIAFLMSVSAFADNTDGKLVYVKGFDSSGNNVSNIWVEHISDAFRNVITDSVSVVIYGNIIESSTIKISSGKFSIRSAKSGTADAEVLDAPPINPDGYTVTWNSIGTGENNCLELTAGNLTIGDCISYTTGIPSTLSGPITFDANSKGRCILNRSFLRVVGPVTIQNGYYPSDLGFGGGAGIFSEVGSLFIDGGVTFINNNAPNYTGGAIWTNIKAMIGTCTFRNNSANKGSALFFTHINNNDSYILLFGAPNMLENQIAYLDNASVFQKCEPFRSGAHLNIQVAGEDAGRDIIITCTDLDTYPDGVVEDGDLAYVNMVLSDNTLEAVYTANGTNNKPVIELQEKAAVLGELTIVKKGMAEGESALFNVKNSSGTVVFHNVSVTAGSDGTGSVTIAGLEVGTYTVEEIRAWSWAYTADQPELRQDILTEPTFTFKNEAKASAPAHGESNINNSFTGGGI